MAESARIHAVRMWQSQNLTPALLSKLRFFSLRLCCWILYVWVLRDGALCFQPAKAGWGLFVATKDKSAIRGTISGQDLEHDFLASDSHTAPGLFIPWAMMGRCRYRPGQHSSICWNHMCPRCLLCPSTSLVSCQLERTDKSCTHFNGPKRSLLSLSTCSTDCPFQPCP